MTPNLKPALRRAAGCVVYTYDPAGALLLLLIRDRQGNWTLPKGHLERGETEAQAAVREVQEETGVQGVLGPLITHIRYTFRKRGERLTKQVAFFLMQAELQPIVPQAAEGISAAEWVPASVAAQQATYHSVREVIEQALSLIPTV